MPLLDEPIPPSQGQYSKDHTRAWAARGASFDGYVFETPEYNHGISGALKNAIDFLYDEPSGQIYANEINTMPGSLSFYLWEPSGVTFPRLIERLIELARRRHRERRRNISTFDSSLLRQFGSGGTKGKGK